MYFEIWSLYSAAPESNFHGDFLSHLGFEPQSPDHRSTSLTNEPHCKFSNYTLLSQSHDISMYEGKFQCSYSYTVAEEIKRMKISERVSRNELKTTRKKIIGS